MPKKFTFQDFGLDFYSNIKSLSEKKLGQHILEQFSKPPAPPKPLVVKSPEEIAAERGKAYEQYLTKKENTFISFANSIKPINKLKELAPEANENDLLRTYSIVGEQIAKGSKEIRDALDNALTREAMAKNPDFINYSPARKEIEKFTYFVSHVAGVTLAVLFGQSMIKSFIDLRNFAIGNVNNAVKTLKTETGKTPTPENISKLYLDIFNNPESSNEAKKAADFLLNVSDSFTTNGVTPRSSFSLTVKEMLSAYKANLPYFGTTPVPNVQKPETIEEEIQAQLPPSPSLKGQKLLTRQKIAEVAVKDPAIIAQTQIANALLKANAPEMAFWKKPSISVEEYYNLMSEFANFTKDAKTALGVIKFLATGMQNVGTYQTIEQALPVLQQVAKNVTLEIFKVALPFILPTFKQTKELGSAQMIEKFYNQARTQKPEEVERPVNDTWKSPPNETPTKWNTIKSEIGQTLKEEVNRIAKENKSPLEIGNIIPDIIKKVKDAIKNKVVALDDAYIDLQDIVSKTLQDKEYEEIKNKIIEVIRKNWSLQTAGKNILNKKQPTVQETETETPPEESPENYPETPKVEQPIAKPETPTEKPQIIEEKGKIQASLGEAPTKKTEPTAVTEEKKQQPVTQPPSAKNSYMFKDLGEGYSTVTANPHNKKTFELVDKILEKHPIDIFKTGEAINRTIPEYQIEYDGNKIRVAGEKDLHKNIKNILKQFLIEELKKPAPEAPAQPAVKEEVPTKTEATESKEIPANLEAIKEEAKKYNSPEEFAEKSKDIYYSPELGRLYSIKEVKIVETPLGTEWWVDNRRVTRYKISKFFGNQVPPEYRKHYPNRVAPIAMNEEFYQKTQNFIIDFWKQANADKIAKEVKPTPPETPKTEPTEKVEFAGTETYKSEVPIKKEFNLEEIEKQLKEEVKSFEKKPTAKDLSKIAKLRDAFMKSLITSTPELNKIPGAQELETLKLFANTIVNNLAIEGLTLNYKELKNGGREINLIKGSAIKMAHELEMKYPNEDIAVAAMGTRLLGLSPDVIKKLSNRSKIFLAEILKKYNELPMELKEKMAKVSEYLQIMTAPLYGVPTEEYYIPFFYISAVTQELTGNPLQEPSFEALPNVFEAMKKEGLARFFIRVEEMALRWRFNNELNKLVALKYGQKEKTFIKIEYHEGGERKVAYLPETDLMREIYKELQPERSNYALRIWASINDNVNRVISGFGTRFNPAFPIVNLTLDQMTILADYFKYPKEALSVFSKLHKVIFKPTLRGIFFERGAGTIFDVYDTSKLKQTAKIIGRILDFTEIFTRNLIAEIMKERGGDYLDMVYAFISSTGAPEKVGLHKIVRVPFLSFGFNAFTSMMRNYFQDPLTPFNQLITGGGISKKRKIFGGLVAIGFLAALAFAGIWKAKKENNLERLKMSNKRGNINFVLDDGRVLSIRVENPFVKALIVVEEYLMGMRPELQEVEKEILAATPLPNIDFGFVPVPIILGIPMQLALNYNWAYNDKIVKNARYPAEPQNKLEKYILDNFGIRPEYTRFIVRSLTTDWDRQLEYIHKIANEQDVTDIVPLLRRLIEPALEDTTNHAIADFYDMVDKLNAGKYEKQLEQFYGKMETYPIFSLADKYKAQIGTLLFNAKNASTTEDARKYRYAATQIALKFFDIMEKDFGIKPSVDYKKELEEYWNK